MLHRVVAYTPVFRTFAHYVLRCITYWSPFLSSRFGALLRNLDGSLTLLPISSLLLLARITVISWRRWQGRQATRRGRDAPDEGNPIPNVPNEFRDSPACL